MGFFISAMLSSQGKAYLHETASLAIYLTSLCIRYDISGADKVADIVADICNC